MGLWKTSVYLTLPPFLTPNTNMVWGVGSYCTIGSLRLFLCSYWSAQKAYGRKGVKRGVVGSKSWVYPRFQNLSFCDVTRVGMISNFPPFFVCPKMPYFMYIEKNGGRLKSTPVFLPPETFKNPSSELTALHIPISLYPISRLQD